MRLLNASHAAIAGPVVVAVMDGIGIGPGDAGDAVAAARAPFLQGLRQQALYTPLRAHGLAVGLESDNEMGNSEVGHNALGAGQIVAQGAKRVAEAVRSGTLFEGACWRDLVAHLQSTGGALHLIGLLSDGNVHGHIDHVLALASQAAKAHLPRCYLHMLLDGRDVPRTSALHYVRRLEGVLQQLRADGGDFRIASGGGRMQITMDRYGADWPMVARGWRCHVHGEAPRFDSAEAAISAARVQSPDLGDQDLPAFVVASGQAPPVRIEDGDAVVAANFRGDRMLELVDAFECERFSHFERGRQPRVFFAGMTQYDGDTQRPQRYLLAPTQIRNTFGEALAASGVSQLAISETQKFGHVTYFWNGNRSGAFAPALEHYEEVPSLALPFAQAPAMQAAQIAERTAALLHGENPARFCRLNLANGDMVGHTGDFAATVAAVRAVDAALVMLCRAVVAQLRGALIVTADHGNAEEMCERDGAAKTSHSRNLVPFAVVLPAPERKRFVLSPQACAHAGLANVAASCAVLMGLQPHEAWQPALIVPRTPAC